MPRPPLVLPPVRRTVRRRRRRRVILIMVLVLLALLGWLAYRRITNLTRSPVEYSGP